MSWSLENQLIIFSHYFDKLRNNNFSIEYNKKENHFICTIWDNKETGVIANSIETDIVSAMSEALTGFEIAKHDCKKKEIYSICPKCKMEIENNGI